MNRAPSREPRSARGQGGVVLIVALIVLVVMTLAGLAMMRQVGAGLSIAGNIAFKENSTSVADAGTEAARTWLVAKTPFELKSSIDAQGYISTWGTSVDPTTFDWTKSLSMAGVDAGTTVSYIVHRLCEKPDLMPTDPGQHCSDYVSGKSGQSRSGASYNNTSPTEPPTPFYRVTTRVNGPRNTTSYTQVLLGDHVQN